MLCLPGCYKLRRFLTFPLLWRSSIQKVMSTRGNISALFLLSYCETTFEPSNNLLFVLCNLDCWICTIEQTVTFCHSAKFCQVLVGYLSCLKDSVLRVYTAVLSPCYPWFLTSVTLIYYTYCDIFNAAFSWQLLSRYWCSYMYSGLLYLEYEDPDEWYEHVLSLDLSWVKPYATQHMPINMFVGALVLPNDSSIWLCLTTFLWNMPDIFLISLTFIKGLGPTVSELDVSKCPVFPKMKFSMMIPEVEEHMKQFPGK